ncbi:MAG: glycoside hydrolase family 3 protein [Treponema sp.]|nr:glycoside hydrolase family 3 protein [Treponema sp.]
MRQLKYPYIKEAFTLTGKARFAIYFFCSLLIIAVIVLVQKRNAHDGRQNSAIEEEYHREAPRDWRQNINEEYRLRAEQIVASMDRSTLAAQVLLASVEGRDSVPEMTRQLLSQIPVGGIIFYGHNRSSTVEQTKSFIEELTLCIAGISVPPFIAVDQEGGRVMRFREGIILPAPLSYWEKLLETNRAVLLNTNRYEEFQAAMEAVFVAIENDAAAAGRELRNTGVTWNLAPVAETLMAQNQGVLKDRSYGPYPVFVAGAASAFIRGMHSGGVAGTLKHFPGNSAEDPHLDQAVLDVSEKELEKLMDTFAETIYRENPAAVMLSHVIIPLWDSKPCSLSPIAVKRLRDMGFTGIIMADDYFMAAVETPVDICAVEALAVGVDMIIVWPQYLIKAHNAILKAIDTETLTEARIREAAERIVYQKIRYDIMR